MSDMDISFTQHRGRNALVILSDSESEKSDQSDSEMDHINQIDDSVEDLKPLKLVNKDRIVIPDSDEDEDEENADDEDNEDDERDEERLVLSKATRLSIFGVQNLGSDDDSDYIESESVEESKSGSVVETEMKPEENQDSDDSVSDMKPNPYVGLPIKNEENLDMSIVVADAPNNADMSVVDLSSDDEPEIKSPPIAKPEFKMFQNPSAPVVTYVSTSTFLNEKKKLQELQEDYVKMKRLIEKMDLTTLPDKGVKLNRRVEEVRLAMRSQAEKVSQMIPEHNPAPPKIDQPIGWDDLREGSNAVQPRMFGTQAMNTHMAQRSLTLKRLHTLHSSLGTRPTESELATPPHGLKTSLMNHQLHALAWLSWRETQSPRGGILADDMGLGKTLTMISLILQSKEKDDQPASDSENEENEENESGWSSKTNGKLPVGGTLVVCPASLMKQWNGEVDTHCKKYSLKTLIHHGLKRETKANRIANFDVVITTYNIVQRDFEKKGALARVRWRRIILDEAHVVRNHKSLTAQAMFGLVGHSKWCLTGTPVHNKDLDLFSLLKFLRCSPFDDIVLWRKWIDNKSAGGQERLTTIMKTLMLRRTKKQLQEENQLLSLPSKTIHLVITKLSKEEMNVYQKVLTFSKTLFAQFLQQKSDKNFAQMNPADQERCYRLHKKMVALHGTREVKAHQILVLILRLRQICCHPGLINAMLDDELTAEDVDKSMNTSIPDIDLMSEISRLNLEDDADELIENNDNEDRTLSSAMKSAFHRSNPVFNLQKKSAKIVAVLNCLEERVFPNVGEKAIIVSQWTSVLDLIRDNLKKSGIKSSTLSGKVPVISRQDIVNDFNSSSSSTQILLLSLCAGGVGLNLVGANHLLLVDLHWNPQLESQAQDRIYRVGQKKPVQVYKFISEATIESSIKLIQDKKLQLAENILTGVKMTSKLSMDDLKLMFNMQ